MNDMVLVLVPAATGSVIAAMEYGKVGRFVFAAIWVALGVAALIVELAVRL